MLIWTKRISPSANITQKAQVKSAHCCSSGWVAEAFFSQGLQKIVNFKKCMLRLHRLFYSFWHCITERQSSFQTMRNILLPVVPATLRKKKASSSDVLCLLQAAVEICSTYCKTNEHISLYCQYPGYRDDKKNFKDMKSDVFKDKFSLTEVRPQAS